MSQKVLVIQRSKWRRGGHDSKLCAQYGATRLLNAQGLMCCLGFDAIACDVPEPAIKDAIDPETVLIRAHQYGALDLDHHYLRSRLAPGGGPQGYEQVKAVGRAMAINDDSALADAEREAQLIPVLKQLGWDDAQFVD